MVSALGYDSFMVHLDFIRDLLSSWSVTDPSKGDDWCVPYGSRTIEDCLLNVLDLPCDPSTFSAMELVLIKQ